MRFLDRLQPVALLALRVALGAIMAAHGYPKVFGGLQGFGQFVGSLGLPFWLGYVAAFTEFVGGLLLVFGVLTRYAAGAIFIEMVVALWKVAGHGSFIDKNSSAHLPLALLTMAAVIACFGGGPVALDRWLFRPGAPKKRPPQ